MRSSSGSAHAAVVCSVMPAPYRNRPAAVLGRSAFLHTLVGHRGKVFLDIREPVRARPAEWSLKGRERSASRSNVERSGTLPYCRCANLRQRSGVVERRYEHVRRGWHPFARDCRCLRCDSRGARTQRARFVTSPPCDVRLAQQTRLAGASRRFCGDDHEPQRLPHPALRDSSHLRRAHGLRTRCTIGRDARTADLAWGVLAMGVPPSDVPEARTTSHAGRAPSGDVHVR